MPALQRCACAALQVKGKIWLDNLLVAFAELLWVATAWLMVPAGWSSMVLISVGNAFGISGVTLLIVRVGAANALICPRFGWPPRLRIGVIGSLLSYGVVVTFGQLADFLYAPIDFILINRLIDVNTGAIYAPTVQIDAGLLMLVMALAGVLLPRTAVAHAAGDRVRVRDYYIRGTLASFAMLLVAAVIVWLISPWLFRIWLDDPLPATQAILPLVLIHTVVGGSSIVGRSILLGTGKVKPFTLSVLLAGVANVALSYIFVRYLHLGLTGIAWERSSRSSCAVGSGCHGTC